MKYPDASGGVSGAKTAKCGTATRLALHRLQVPPQGAGNLSTAIKHGDRAMESVFQITLQKVLGLLPPQ